MDPYFGTLIPAKFVTWLLTHFVCDFDINDSIPEDENISMIPAEQMNLKL